MTTFADIVADVGILTNRPDLDGEISLGIRAATIKLHSIDDWREDLVEELVAVSTVNNVFSIDLTTLTNSARKIVYVKKSDSDTFFEEISPAHIKDAYGDRLVNVYYRAGNLLHFFSDSADVEVYIGYFKHPVAVSAGYSSWIADTYSVLVALEAAKFVAGLIGNKELEARMEHSAAEQIVVLHFNHLADT